MRRLPSIVAVLSVTVLAPYGAHGQTNGAFTGRITDNTGSVLPGATVVAASPALIEGSRVAISDEGRPLHRWPICGRATTR